MFVLLVVNISSDFRCKDKHNFRYRQISACDKERFSAETRSYHTRNIFFARQEIYFPKIQHSTFNTQHSKVVTVTGDSPISASPPGQEKGKGESYIYIYIYI